MRLCRQRAPQPASRQLATNGRGGASKVCGLRFAVNRYLTCEAAVRRRFVPVVPDARPTGRTSQPAAGRGRVSSRLQCWHANSKLPGVPLLRQA